MNQIADDLFLDIKVEKNFPIKQYSKSFIFKGKTSIYSLLFNMYIIPYDCLFYDDQNP